MVKYLQWAPAKLAATKTYIHPPPDIFSILFSLNLLYMSSDNVYLITEVWGYCVRSGTQFLRIYWMDKININISEKVF